MYKYFIAIGYFRARKCFDKSVIIVLYNMKINNVPLIIKRSDKIYY